MNTYALDEGSDLEHFRIVTALLMLMMTQIYHSC